MDTPEHLTAQQALICAMLLMAASTGHVDDAELAQMTRLVQDLPAFAELTPEEVARSTEACLPLLHDEEGLEHAFDLIREALPPRLRETAYLLACEVAAADGEAVEEELRMLQQLRIGLELDRLIAGAIERAARARYQVI
ncbi:MAG: tellurite resistance TerB family protein [Rubritepida sp.]|jgi:tellurite resistance protein|nr:tellurite resistance TerB family protein [Rubritepida sp.]MCU0945055.1 tellurite resistance TerB family protein [Rubritepida sp.]